MQSKANDHSPDDRLPFRPVVGCGIALVLGLAAGLMLFQLTRLVLEGELRLGSHPLQPSRMWIVREESRAGLGLELSSTVDGGLQQASICRRSRVLFLLWRAEPNTQRAIEFCDCYQAADGGWSVAGACDDFP